MEGSEGVGRGVDDVWSERPRRALEYVGFWRRVAAHLIDTTSIAFVVACFAYGVLGLELPTRDVGGSFQFDLVFQRNVIKVANVLTWLLYCTVMEASGLQGSLGKRLVGAVVVSKSGDPLDFEQALLRNVSKLLSLLPLGLGCFWVAFSYRRQAWHDKIAETYVVDRPIGAEES